MHEYDPMKDNSGRNDSPRQDAVGNDTRRASEPAAPEGPAFEEPASEGPASEGRGYTNPDGSHGRIYNDRSATDHCGRHWRGVIIALAVAVITLTLIPLACMGALVAFRSLSLREDPEETTAEGLSTSDGLVIFDGTSGENADAADPMETDQTGASTLRDPSTPLSATIHKLPPKREDKNGDGRPDVVFDEKGEVLTSADKGAVSVATVVARVAASVVEITTETIVQSGHIGQYISSGAGSGVIISEEGFIVTNHHVIDGAGTITVRMSDGTEFPATLVGSDERTDIAVLWIDPGAYSLTVATLGASFDLVVGEDILAIGNPLGSLGGTVTEGMVSATARQINVGGTDMTLLQISAPINPGNSGGGLFNLAGELVGVVNAKMSSEEIEGLGFAIPVDTAYDVVLELIEHGYVRGHPSSGFSVVDVADYRTAVRYFNSYYTGVYVYDDRHDVVQYGDLILKADGREITKSEELNALIDQKKVGETIELVVFRAKQEVTLTVTIVEDIPEALRPAA